VIEISKTDAEIFSKLINILLETPIGLPQNAKETLKDFKANIDLKILQCENEKDLTEWEKIYDSLYRSFYSQLKNERFDWAKGLPSGIHAHSDELDIETFAGIGDDNGRVVICFNGKYGNNTIYFSLYNPVLSVLNEMILERSDEYITVSGKRFRKGEWTFEGIFGSPIKTIVGKEMQMRSDDMT